VSDDADRGKSARLRYLAPSRSKARTLPLFNYGRGDSMETFFVRKQIIIGAAFLAAVELGLMLINVLKHAH
jgi:hypothetical protein